MPESTDETSDSDFETPEIINPPPNHLEDAPLSGVNATPSAAANQTPADVSTPASPENQELRKPSTSAERQVGERSINGELS